MFGGTGEFGIFLGSLPALSPVEFIRPSGVVFGIICGVIENIGIYGGICIPSGPGMAGMPIAMFYVETDQIGSYMNF